MAGNEKPKPSGNASAVGCLTLIIIVFAIVFIARGCGNDEKPAVSTIYWPTSTVTGDTVRQALSQNNDVKPMANDSKFPGDITNVEVNDNVSKPGTKIILISYKRDSIYDETHLLKESGGTAIIAGSRLFANPAVEEIALFAQVDMTDQYGKTNVSNGVKIVMNRALADKADWKGLAERHLTDPGNIYRISDNYSIHPGILKNVKMSEINLK